MNQVKGHRLRLDQEIALSADRQSSMESTGRASRRWPWSYYCEQTGSNSYTSSSGTVSTGYTASTSSQLSWMSMEAARHFQEMEMKDLEFVESPKEKATEKKMKLIKILAKEFFGAPSGAKGGDLSVLERWFMELGVGWVLHIADGAPAGELEHALDASSWIPPLTEIMHTFRLTLWLSPKSCIPKSSNWISYLLHPGYGSVEEEEQLRLACFTQQAMLKMLTFVDSIVAPNLTRESFIVDDGVPAPAPYKLHNLLRVHEALSQAFSILSTLDSSSSAKIARIQGGIVNLLSAKEGKVGEAIWSALEEIRTRIVESLDDGQGLSCTQTPQGSSDIDEATNCIQSF